MASKLLRQAVCDQEAGLSHGILQRTFAWSFQRWVYNQIWEDPAVDLRALRVRPDSRIVTIASGGCNVLNYLAADPEQITAVDLNPAHVALTRLKLAGLRHFPDHETFFAFFGTAHGKANRLAYRRYLQPLLDAETRAWWEGRTWLGRRLDCFDRGLYRHSLLGSYIGFLHRLVALTGRRPSDLLRARSLDEQRRLFEETIAPLFELKLVRALCRLPMMTYSLGIPPQQQMLLAGEGTRGNVADVYRERVRRLACDFPIRDNYFAWQAFGRGYDLTERRAVPDYLRADRFRLLRSRASRVEVRLASITDHLAGEPAASVDRYVLLDAQDWMNPRQLADLWCQIGRTARPGARVIFRTAARETPLDCLPPHMLDQWEYEKALGDALHAEDRSAIYGGFHVYGLRDAA